MKRLIPAIRISLSIVLITISLLLVGDLLGLFPDRSKELSQAREKTSESLAVLFSGLASKGQMEAIGFTIKSFVERNPEVLSAGLRQVNGKLIISYGDHAKYWSPLSEDQSTLDSVTVPIFEGNKRWGAIEVQFKPIVTDTPFEKISNTIYGLVIYVGLFGFGAYLLLIRRTLRELDPSSVIPERVSAAFNALAEGLLILDEKQQVVLANSAFAEKFGRTTESLVGYKANELGWADKALKPWDQTLQTGESLIGVSVKAKSSSGKLRSLVVNSAPITDAAGNCRGVLATFDDVTELIEKNEALESMVCKLEDNKHEIEQQNEELHYLATRDPMTGCLNRRAFNEQFQAMFKGAKEGQTELTCIMADIDHFKSVNDNFGHGVGDEVIKLLAEVLHSCTRDSDLVARYGGEEFCLVLPNIMINAAYHIADRIRRRVKDEARKQFPNGPRVTVSLGVASIYSGARTAEELNNYADKALYMAKESGRNRVIKWDPAEIAKVEGKVNQPSAVKSDKASAIQLGEKLSEVASDGAPEDMKRLKVRLKQLESMATSYSKKLQYQANYDRLTGLPNQLLFYDRVQQAIARSERFNRFSAVMSLDVDLFKRVNNSLGRVVGDQLLKVIASRLKDIVRETDGITLLTLQKKDLVVSHLGADEFGILITDLPEIAAVSIVVKRIHHLLSEVVEIEKQKIYLSSSIGISICPDDGETADTLLKHASIARQHAKQMPGNNNHQFFDKQMNDNSVKQIELESELKEAIKNREFVLFYQPKVELSTGKICGVEALIRWEHPTKGLLSPIEFIAAAERSNLIIEIGEWVIETACHQMRRWQKMGLYDCTVAINLSTIQLRQENLSEFIVETLEQTGILPQSLELEVTETVIMDNVITASDTLNYLHSKGVKISIDDFGTGYSSLSYLKYLPLDTLKIDHSFIRDILTDQSDQSIVKTIIAMAHGLKLRVVAEGVEEKEQLALLKTYGCDEVQGYLYSRPVTADNATVLLKEDFSQVLVVS